MQASSGARDEPRLHVLARRQREQPIPRDEIPVFRERPARQEQSLLPMATQERAGVEAGEHRALHGGADYRTEVGASDSRPECR